MADTTNIYEKPKEQLSPEERAREQQEKLERQKRGRERIGKTIDAFGKHLNDKELVDSLPPEMKKEVQQAFFKAVTTVPGRSKERPRTGEKTPEKKSQTIVPEYKEASEKREIRNEKITQALDLGNEVMKESIEKEKALNKLSLVTEVASVYAEYLGNLKSRVQGNLFQGSRLESYDTQIKVITDLLVSVEKMVSVDSKTISKKSDEIIAKAFTNEYVVSRTQGMGSGIESVGKDIGVDKSLVSKDSRFILDSEKRSEMDFTKIRDILTSSATLNTNELLSKKVQALSLLRLHDTHDSNPRVLNSSEATRSSLEGDFLAMKDLSKYPKVLGVFKSIDSLKKNPVAQKEFFSLLFPEGTVPELNANTFNVFFQKHAIHIDVKHIGEIIANFSDIRKTALVSYQESIKDTKKDKDARIDLSELSKHIQSKPESLANGQKGCMDILSRLLIQKTVFENFTVFDTISQKNPLAKLYTNIEGLQSPETNPRHEKGFSSSMRSLGSGYLSDERVNSDAKFQQEMAEQVLMMVGVGKVVGSLSRFAGKSLAEKFGSGLVTSEMTSIGDFVGSKLIGRGIAPVLATTARLGTETITEGGAFALGYTQIDNLVGSKGWENGMNIKDLGRITAFLGVVKSLHIGVEAIKPLLAGLGEKYGAEMRTLVETKGIADLKVMDALLKELGGVAKTISKPKMIREGAGIIADTATLVVADTAIRVAWDQGVPNVHEGQNMAEYMQSELGAIVPLVLGIRSMERAKGPVDVAYQKDGSLLVTLDGQITRITKEQRRLIQVRNIARRDGDRSTVSNINAERQENKQILIGLQAQKNLADSTVKTIAANEPFTQGNTNHTSPSLREMRESMRNPNIEKVAKGFGIETKLQGEVTSRFQELLANFPSISKSSDQHKAIHEVMATEVDTLITRLEANKDFNYGQDKVELEKFRQNRERTISDLTKQFDEALKAKTLGEKMDPKWGKVEYVDKLMGMFYEKMSPEMKEEKYRKDGESNKRPKSKSKAN